MAGALKRRNTFEELEPLMRLAETGPDDVAEAAAYGIANIGGWEACLWLAEMALQPDAPAYYMEALATGGSAWSGKAMAFLRSDWDELATAVARAEVLPGLAVAVDGGGAEAEARLDDSERWF